jgi:acyl-homoserine-lactone acylase
MIKHFIFFISIVSTSLFAQSFTKEDILRWEKQAANVIIIRDNWGIPHVYGKTDADAVFGLLYAQCEDDFGRVEMNYIEKLGRFSEVKGKSELYNDLLIRLVIDSSEAMADYKKSPEWLHKLLNAHADGINYFLYKHPDVKPLLLKRFQPWYSLLWTDGSIGAISTADLSVEELKRFYENSPELGYVPKINPEENPTGSNGFAFAPSITESGNSILYINPHVTFYFRPEVHMVSEEGLNVYGAVTWGQFFIYQGFNEHCGWMHTSSYTDISDTYIEKLSKKNDKWFYEYEKVQKPVLEKKLVLKYSGDKPGEKIINALFTGHGAIMAKRNGQYLSLKANNRSMTGLIQSWQRTKANSFADYKKVMELKANTSNNTVYADAEGNIAYWHGNFLPVRDTAYDWSKPVDGSKSATQWKGLHKVDESIHIYNPPNGWLQNCNSTPFTAAGANSPKKENYPKYMKTDEENFRGINAVRVLSKEKKYNLDKVIAAGYDTYLSSFEILLPALVKAFEKNIIQKDSLFSVMAEPISILKYWDYYSRENSIATTLAIEWANLVLPSIYATKIPGNNDPGIVEMTNEFAKTADANTLLKPLAKVINDLNSKWGRWQITWGEINRFQRISNDITQKYNDDSVSVAVGFAPALWGQLPSYTARYFPGTKKRYGVNGNSFVCAVEFGKRIKAKSLLAGGESGNPRSPHFKDQLEMYAKGKFKDVLFYREDVEKNAERKYHPGE